MEIAEILVFLIIGAAILKDVICCYFFPQKFSNTKNEEQYM